MEKLLKIDNICDLLGVKRSTIYEWVHIGYISYYKFPKGVRFRESEIDQWIRNKKKKSRSRYNVYPEIRSVA